ncbi:MAG: hypothetical protein LBP22_17515, partial [Deltaproteobacteria bacterium]|nr:hypothetical protein [Deltaproteobacteria bacterium]
MLYILAMTVSNEYYQLIYVASGIRWMTLLLIHRNVCQLFRHCLSPNLPSERNNETNEQYNSRIQKKINQYYQKIDATIMERQSQLENIVNYYNGEFMSSFIEDGDTFSVTVKMSGKGLRDVVLNYFYIFEMSFKSEVTAEITAENIRSISDRFTIIRPRRKALSYALSTVGFKRTIDTFHRVCHLNDVKINPHQVHSSAVIIHLVVKLEYQKILPFKFRG